ncbi:MAG: histidine phosphatase family protein, partial [Bacteroidota bacterium]
TLRTDPPLSPSGKERAMSLAHVLRDAGVVAIYATQYVRTQQTVKPLAEGLAVHIEVVNADPQNLKGHAEALVKGVMSGHSGGVVLISSHSNVIPLIIRALGVSEPPAIADHEYDNLFVVTKCSIGEAKLLRLKYGKPAR